MSLNKQHIIFLVPAYNPEVSLIEAVRELRDNTSCPVVVVDDGSELHCRAVFEAVAEAGATVLRHAVNLGKGMALKTGFNHVACAFPGCVGVVTFDADGQHLIRDVLAVADALLDEPNSLVVGCRRFGTGVPLRSRFGNIMTRGVMRLVGGLSLSDTQSGLRGIPSTFFPCLLRTKTTGYDFELDMLLKARVQGIGIREVPIETVYLDGNNSSHFNPFLDSLKIYMVFFRFNLSSLLSVVIDYGIFICLYSLFGSLALSQFTGRVCAGAVNYFVNKNFVFKSHKDHRSAMTLYVLGLTAFGLISYCMIYAMQTYVGFNVVISKVIAELLLYIAGFFIQREIVFGVKNKC